MFITTKAKNEINDRIIRNTTQIENVVKHVAKLQVDMGNSDISKIAGLQATNSQLQRMYFGAKDEMKKMQQQLTMLREINDLIIERVSKMELLARARAQMTIPKEKVQQMKDEGTWDDPEKRGPLLVSFIKEKRQEEEKRAKRSAYGKKYYAKKKAKLAALKETA
jgi:hypothetical protein